MNEQDFIAKVLSALPPLREDLDIMRRTAAELYSWGFTIPDAIAYCKCFEEVNPNLDEETALKRMKLLKGKYNGCK